MEPEPNTIEAQASRWVARLDAGPLSAEEQAELDAWTASDRRHHGALIRARAAWLDADRLAALAAGTVRTTLNPSTRAPYPVATQSLASRLVYATAASLAVLSLALGAIWYARVYTGPTYSSEIGEVRKVQLADGSELTLNTDTRATVRYRDAERDVTLKQGEALFEVAHDITRPFIVHANDVRVQAIGTAFSVRVDDERVDVLVTEGIVEVSRGDAAPPQRINAGHRAVLASSASRFDIEPINTQAVRRHLAWREGTLAFAGEPLSVAVAEINRHSRHPIHIDDAALAAQPVVGIFRANDTQAFANAVAATFGAEISYADDTIHLKAKASRE